MLCVFFQLVVKNVDDLFDWPEFSAGKEFKRGTAKHFIVLTGLFNKLVQDMAGTYNTGVFVLEPNSDTYEAMLSVSPLQFILSKTCAQELTNSGRSHT